MRRTREALKKKRKSPHSLLGCAIARAGDDRREKIKGKGDARGRRDRRPAPW